MTQASTLYKEQLHQEIEATPKEYLPALLNIVRLYRQSVALNPADASFQQGWQEAMNGVTSPLSDLWVDIDAE